MITYRVKKERGRYYPQKTWFFGYFSYKNIRKMENVSFATRKEAFNYIFNVKEFVLKYEGNENEK